MRKQLDKSVHTIFRMLTGLVLLLSLASGTSAAFAEEKVTVSFNNTDIKDVIRWAADLTDKNILVNKAVAGKVTVIAGEPMSKAEAYQVFLSILQVNDIAVVETPTSLKIFPEQAAKTNSIPLIEGVNEVGDEDLVVRIIKIKNVAATQIIPLLKPLTPASAHFQAYPETNILIIADRASNIKQIAEIVERIDQAGTIDIEIIQLQYASAKDIVNVVSSLVPKTAPAAKGTPESNSLNYAADERSNSILITGDPVTRMQLRKLIQELDRPLSGEGNTQVFYLNYANAADMVPILESVSGSVVKATEKDAPQADVEVSIQALEANNALIITAPPSLLNTMRGVIAKLDVRRAQVLVEALIVEVNSDFDRDLGVSWISDPVTGDGGRASFGSPSIPSVNPNNFGPSGTFAGGLAVGVFRDGSLRGLLNVLEADGDTNVLSTPTVIALDNEEAEILVGQNVPFKTGQEDRSGTDNDFVTIEREDVGISLKVKPRVNNDNSLTLEIEQKVESVEESGTADASDIITNKREIRTKALVKNNEILVLGGLMSDTIEVNTSKVPFFGDIPVIGHLFKSSSKKKVKQNLMVFIHPVILLDDVTTESESGRRYNEIRELQRDFNDQENWLQIKKSALPLLPEYKTEVESNTDSVADMPVEDPAIMNP